MRYNPRYDMTDRSDCSAPKLILLTRSNLWTLTTSALFALAVYIATSNNNNNNDALKFLYGNNERISPAKTWDDGGRGRGRGLSLGCNHRQHAHRHRHRVLEEADGEDHGQQHDGEEEDNNEENNRNDHDEDANDNRDGENEEQDGQNANKDYDKDEEGEAEGNGNGDENKDEEKDDEEEGARDEDNNEQEKEEGEENDGENGDDRDDEWHEDGDNEDDEGDYEDDREYDEREEDFDDMFYYYDFDQDGYYGNEDDYYNEPYDQDEDQQRYKDDYTDESQDDASQAQDAKANSAKYIDDFYAFAADPHAPTVFPLKGRYIAGYVIVALAMTIGASGGTGGGGVVVPVYMLLMGLTPHVAVPLGAVTVLGGVTSSTIFNSFRRHPLADRPIIDWDLVLVMTPLTLIGTLVGTILHRVLSDKLLVVLLVMLLSVVAQSTLRKGMRMYKAEIRYIHTMKASQNESSLNTNTWGFGDHDLPSVEAAELDRQRKLKRAMDEKQQILIENPDFITLRSDMLEEEKFAPRSKIFVLMCMFSVLILLNVMVGGGSYESPWGIRCGSFAFWFVHVIMVAFLLISGRVAQTYLIARHEIKAMVRYDYAHGDIKWDARSAILYPAIFMFAGITAGTFGIGGGVVIVPLLLSVGVHPAVAATTAS
jgi:uncharacterized membrane protein YfcA